MRPRATFTNRASLALLASFVVACAPGESPEPAKVRITTWNLEWFPNGSAHDATPEVQAQRIAAAADALRPINPDIILLEEVQDYEACETRNNHSSFSHVSSNQSTKPTAPLRNTFRVFAHNTLPWLISVSLGRPMAIGTLT